MRKRNIRYQLWLDEQEAERFNRLVQRSGLPREVYLRQLINGLVPTDTPPPDYFYMMKELRAIGTNLNQIARKANVLNVIDVQRYDAAVVMLNNAVIEITRAVMLPRKMERKIE
ncbi:MAG: plasmid mobilization relaxosome protein MobC [Oscillospiraceae bacterium]|jgi:hypothetical protein|nr:plasmid mobilization relaxosome protein MobC [Oscillospiraceae bacterium]